MKPQAVLLLLLLSACLVGTGGCRKKSVAPPAEVLDLNAPDRMPSAPNDSSLRLPIQREITTAVHHFETDHRRLPPDFETLVKMKYLPSMPQPPAGKRFALDRNRMQVVITD
jgi:hypothetical protein